MNWRRYREFQGYLRDEVVLAFDQADHRDPFLKLRTEQYRRIGKSVRLQGLHPETSDHNRSSQ
ncbi:MAG: hypothetical protein HZA50_10105 [Planctomycetes bacterium]|nr:hypothetical protein [Planctomycetota bacterium]